MDELALFSLASIIWAVRQRPPGKGQEGELESFGASDGRGGAPAPSFQKLGGDDPEGL